MIVDYDIRTAHSSVTDRVVRTDGSAAEGKNHGADSAGGGFRRLPAALFFQPPLVGPDQETGAAAVSRLCLLPFRSEGPPDSSQVAGRGLNREFRQDSGTRQGSGNIGAADGLQRRAGGHSLSEPGGRVQGAPSCRPVKGPRGNHGGGQEDSPDSLALAAATLGGGGDRSLLDRAGQDVGPVRFALVSSLACQNHAGGPDQEIKVQP